MRKKIFGIGAVVILILVAVIPAVCNAQIGNNGTTRYEKRLGWLYTKIEYKHYINYDALVLSLNVIKFSCYSVVAIAAYTTLNDDLNNDSCSYIKLIGDGGAFADCLLQLINMIQDKTIRKNLQTLLNDVNALLTWLKIDQDYLKDMIVTGCISGCKIGEIVTIYCIGPSTPSINKITCSSTKINYNMVVSSVSFTEKRWQSHNCQILITGNKHSLPLANLPVDAWCYSNGILETNFQFST